METKEFLLNFREGKISLEEAETYIKNLPYQELGFAKLDYHRKVRSGFGEVVFCQGKTSEQIAEIFLHIQEQEGGVLGTRACERQYREIQKVIPQVIYDRVSHTLILRESKPVQIGNVVVCTGGTSDIPVAEEAAVTAEFFGAKVERIYDVGVAGIHRLLSKIEELRQANCIVAVAGMEGALGSVVAGLVDKPVIGVPTSVGYGTSFNGMSALLTMLNSCAEGMAVVNIDNGFGAGYLSAQINRACQKGLS